MIKGWSIAQLGLHSEYPAIDQHSRLVALQRVPYRFPIWRPEDSATRLPLNLPSHEHVYSRDYPAEDYYQFDVASRGIFVSMMLIVFTSY